MKMWTLAVGPLSGRLELCQLVVLIVAVVAEVEHHGLPPWTIGAGCGIGIVLKEDCPGTTVTACPLIDHCQAIDNLSAAVEGALAIAAQMSNCLADAKGLIFKPM
eukprot:3599836-Amphidinium_carterae.2